MRFAFGKFIHLHDAKHFFDALGDGVFRHAVLLQTKGDVLSTVICGNKAYD